MLKNRALSFLVYTLDSKVIIGAQGLKPFSLVTSVIDEMTEQQNNQEVCDVFDCFVDQPDVE